MVKKENSKKKINALFKSPEEFFWRTNRFGEQVKEAAELEDILGIVGWLPSQILKPEEIFNYQKFGFGNMTDFTGSVSALANNVLYRDSREGYKWESKTKDGKVFVSEITGDHNADLRIYRTDITPYETLDPVGNKVSFRPEMD